MADPDKVLIVVFHQVLRPVVAAAHDRLPFDRESVGID